MKLQTSIPPRRDGTLTVTAKDGQRFAFAKGPDGELVGDVTDEETVAHLLATGMYWPADAADFDKALALENPPQGGDAQDDEETDDDDGDEVVNGGLPVEANTPPVPAKKAGKAKAK